MTGATTTGIRPHRELFLWALLLNRKEIALIFWKAGVDHIGGALVAASLLSSLAIAAEQDEELDLAEQLNANARLVVAKHNKNNSSAKHNNIVDIMTTKTIYNVKIY